ncbi:MAG: hypothetical protein RLZZ136_1774 [Pseudomonadota bacterium]
MHVLVIGRGFGASVMAPAYEALGFKVTLVSSRDTEAIQQACAGPFDLVSIHSPPFQHHAHVLIALAAGRPVLCDKPFGRNEDEARAMRDAAQKAGVLHFLNFEFRCQPAWAKAHELIVQRAIGDLIHVNWLNYGSGFRGRPHGWLYEAESAGGWMGAYGSHVIDGLRYFFGKEIDDCGGIVRTETQLRPNQAGEQVRSTAEDAFSCWFTMQGGGTASVDTGYSAPVSLPSAIHLLGSDAALSISGESEVILYRPGQAPEVFDLTPKPGESRFPAPVLWLEKVAEALQTGQQIVPNFNDGLAVNRAIAIVREKALKQ